MDFRASFIPVLSLWNSRLIGGALWLICCGECLIFVRKYATKWIGKSPKIINKWRLIIMLKKSYSGIQFQLSVSFKQDKDLPLKELLQLESDIASAVNSLAKCETIALKIMEDKTSGETSP
jgi:hypothetical protein